MNELTVWNSGLNLKAFPKLAGQVNTDVLVIGAGITGLTTAYLLAKEGKRVVVVEASTISQSASSRSSAHLTTAYDYGYSELRSKFNLETSQDVASSRKFAISFIDNLSQQFPCDFKYVSGYLYAEDVKDLDWLQKEKETAERSGLDVYNAETLQLPFRIAGAIEFKHQAVFNPTQYLYGIAGYLDSLPNCSVFENSRIISRNGGILNTEIGNIRANQVVYATHYPIFFDLRQIKAYPYRSYVLAAKVKEDIGDDLYWDTFDPYFYTRTYRKEGNRYLVVGGADHKTGDERELSAFKKLESYLRLRYQVESIDYKWSNQYYEPADGLPFIGKISDNEYIATGYSGDGLTSGTIAGYIISQEIMGLKEKLWDGIFDSKRGNIIASAGKFIKENINVARHFIGDRLTTDDKSMVDQLREGEGIVIEDDHDKIAVCIDETGTMHSVKANCTHLNCLVNWNYFEKTWDCPCHGSRFKPDGSVITGPAVQNLEKVEIKIHT